MWQYSKKLEYPVKIKKANPAMAKLIISQLGGLNINKLYNAKPPYRIHVMLIRGFPCIIDPQ